MSDAVPRRPLDDRAAPARPAKPRALERSAHDPLIQRDWPLEEIVSAATLVRLQVFKVLTGLAALLLLAVIWIVWRAG